jgi:brefeldin A-resistance guanine nucleotide exchange factor 1
VQLLDLMHTLHTKAAAIYNSWAQDPAVPDITDVPVEDQQQIIDRSSSMGLPQDNESGTSALWTHCWCPLLQGILTFSRNTSALT